MDTTTSPRMNHDGVTVRDPLQARPGDKLLVQFSGLAKDGPEVVTVVTTDVNPSPMWAKKIEVRRPDGSTRDIDF